MRRISAAPLTLLAALLVLPAAPASAAVAPSPASSPAPDRALYEEGRQAVLEMRWTDAIGVFERLLASHPRSPFGDGALYWRAFARAEAGDCAAAYTDLLALEERHPASPRAAAGRALRVRCAGTLLMERPDDPRRAEYARLITEATQRDALPARLSAAEVLLSADPVEGARAVHALAAGLQDRTLLEVLLDRHFADSLALARAADPALPLGPANAVVLVRRPDGVEALGVAEALRVARDDKGSAYSPRARADIQRALDAIRRAYSRGNGTVGRERSRVARVDESEIHLYHGSEETVRILVLDRRRGYREENVRVFVEHGARLTELSMREAEKMAQEGDTRVMGAHALTFVGSSLALIRLDLEAATSLQGGGK